MTQQVHFPIKPGIRFRDGKLYLFAGNGIIVLRQWPDLRAWRKTPKGPWKHIRPGLEIAPIQAGWRIDLSARAPRVRPTLDGLHIRDLLTRGQEEWTPPFDDEEPGDPIAPAENRDGPLPSPFVAGTGWRQYEFDHIQAYLQTIPAEVLAIVTRFPGRHWHLLSLIARCPGAVDLIRSTPALAFALASLWVFRQPAPRRPLRSIRTLLRKPQSHIAGWLGYPATRSTVRVLRKLPPGQCHVPNLLHLRQLCGTHAKALRHMSRLGTENLRLMVKSGEAYHLGSAYLAEMGADPAPEWLDREPRTLQDVLWLLERLGDEEPVTFHSHAHLLRIHDQLVQRIGRTDLATVDLTSLPDPPFPGVATEGLHLEPITTEFGLMQEGISQSNCVGAYGRRVRRGGLCIYRVLAPERATLSITGSRDGSWTISELQGYHNTPINDRTTIAVQEWLDASNSGDSDSIIQESPG